MLIVKKVIDDRRSYLLPQLKKYAGAVDDTQDAILQRMLTTAALEIQEHADVSTGTRHATSVSIRRLRRCCP